MSPVRLAAFGVLCLLSLVGLSACGKSNEKVMAQCMTMMEEHATKDNSLLTRALDRKGYCSCLIEKGTPREDHTMTARECMTAHSREGFIRLCGEELAPEVTKGTQKTLDCGCFYDQSTSEALKLVKDGKIAITPQQEQEVALKALQACSQ